jgi:hypothetical protein
VAEGDYDLRAQRFDAAGAMLGTEIQVNADTVGRQWFGDIAMDATGAFVVVWGAPHLIFETPPTIGTGGAVRKFDATGTPLGTEFRWPLRRRATCPSRPSR